MISQYRIEVEGLARPPRGADRPFSTLEEALRAIDALIRRGGKWAESDYRIVAEWEENPGGEIREGG